MNKTPPLVAVDSGQCSAMGHPKADSGFPPDFYHPETDDHASQSSEPSVGFSPDEDAGDSAPEEGELRERFVLSDHSEDEPAKNVRPRRSRSRQRDEGECEGRSRGKRKRRRAVSGERKRRRSREVADESADMIGKCADTNGERVCDSRERPGGPAPDPPSTKDDPSDVVSGTTWANGSGCRNERTAKAAEADGDIKKEEGPSPSTGAFGSQDHGRWVEDDDDDASAAKPPERSSERPEGHEEEDREIEGKKQDLPPNPDERAFLEAAEGIARDVFGLTELKPEQREVLSLLLNGRDVFHVAPTGHGKSLLYQLFGAACGETGLWPERDEEGNGGSPASHRPETGVKDTRDRRRRWILTVVVNPLVAICRDQLARLSSCGPTAAGGKISAQDLSSFQGKKLASAVRSIRRQWVRADTASGHEEDGKKPWQSVVVFASPEALAAGAEIETEDKKKMDQNDPSNEADSDYGCSKEEDDEEEDPQWAKSARKAGSYKSDSGLKGLILDAARLDCLALFAMDEVHACLEWSRFFRTAFRRIRDLRCPKPGSDASHAAAMFNVPYLFLTATADDTVVADAGAVFAFGGGCGKSASLVVPRMDEDFLWSERQNVRFEVVRVDGAETCSEDVARAVATKIALRIVADYGTEEGKKRLPAVLSGAEGTAKRKKWVLPVSGLIYCLTKSDAKIVAAVLDQFGISCKTMTGDLPRTARDARQSKWSEGGPDCRVLACTSCFSMGVDKRSVGFVFHARMARGIAAYVQESGRGGRDGSRCNCVLFFHGRDVSTVYSLVAGPFKEPAEVKAAKREFNRRVAEALEEASAGRGESPASGTSESRPGLRTDGSDKPRVAPVGCEVVSATNLTTRAKERCRDTDDDGLLEREFRLVSKCMVDDAYRLRYALTSPDECLRVTYGLCRATKSDVWRSTSEGGGAVPGQIPLEKLPVLWSDDLETTCWDFARDGSPAERGEEKADKESPPFVVCGNCEKRGRPGQEDPDGNFLVPPGFVVKRVNAELCKLVRAVSATVRIPEPDSPEGRAERSSFLSDFLIVQRHHITLAHWTDIFLGNSKSKEVRLLGLTVGNPAWGAGQEVDPEDFDPFEAGFGFKYDRRKTERLFRFAFKLEILQVKSGLHRCRGSGPKSDTADVAFRYVAPGEESIVDRFLRAAEGPTDFHLTFWTGTAEGE